VIKQQREFGRDFPEKPIFEVLLEQPEVWKEK
jgi:hypothetical protein